MIKRRKKIVSSALAVVLFASVGFTGVIPAKEQVYADVKASSNTKWTIAVYACGSDLESSSGETSKDLLEMIQAEDMPDSINIVVQTGGSTSWKTKAVFKEYYKELNLPDDLIENITPDISADYIQRYKISYNHKYTTENGKEIEYATLDLLNDKVAVNNPKVSSDSKSMGDEQLLEDYLTYIEENFPAEHTMVDFWNHGGGTTGGFCVDEYNDDSISISEMKKALNTGYESRGNQTYDLVGFDCCIMANYETLQLMAPYAQYAVASLTNEPGYGWYYTPFLEKLGKNIKSYSAEEISKDIVESYKEYYEENGVLYKNTLDELLESGMYADENEAAEEAIKQLKNYSGEAIISAFDLKKVPTTLEKFNGLSEMLLYMMQDKESFEKFQDVTENCILDKSFELVCFEKFLDKTSDFAKKEAALLAKSSDIKKKNVSEKYARYSEIAKELSYDLFKGEASAVISTYSGWKGNKFKNAGPVSVYYPTIGSSGAYEFEQEQYPENVLGSLYKMFSYAVAYDLQYRYNQKFDDSLSYDTSKNTYTYSIPANVAKYQYSLSTIRYITDSTGTNYYLGRKDTMGKSKISVKGENSYIAFNGVPISVDDSLKDEGFYSFDAIVNGEEAKIFYTIFEKKYCLGWYDSESYSYEDLKPGDVIIPKSIVSSKIKYLSYDERQKCLKEIKKGKYVVKSSDVKKDYTKLPISIKSLGNDKLTYVFCTIKNTYTNNYPDVLSEKASHSYIVKFAKVKVSLKKTSYKLTGKPIKPSVIVKSGSTTYKKDKDYKVTYKNNIGLGKATVTVQGLGKYSLVKSFKVKFTIKK